MTRPRIAGVELYYGAFLLVLREVHREGRHADIAREIFLPREKRPPRVTNTERSKKRSETIGVGIDEDREDSVRRVAYYILKLGSATSHKRNKKHHRQLPSYL